VADLARYDVEEHGVRELARHDAEGPRVTRLARHDVEEPGVTRLARHDVEEHRTAEAAGRQRGVWYGPGGFDGHPDGEHESLPDRTGADSVRHVTEAPTAAEPARPDADEPRPAEPATRQRAVRHEPGGADPHAGGDREPLPDYTGVDLTALRARVDHPVLGAVLATLLARSCAADGGLVAYHEDSPGAER